jgi:Amt family ammonium transporter
MEKLRSHFAALALGLAFAVLFAVSSDPLVHAQTAPAAAADSKAAAEKDSKAPAASEATAASAPDGKGDAKAQAEPAPAEPAVGPPAPNKGDTAWMLVSTLLVVMMAVPGLALFYGGLVRAKNVLSVLMQVSTVFSLIVVLWAIYGYSLAFTGGSAFIGGFDKIFLAGVNAESAGATFSKGVYIPEILFAAFQSTFAAVTCALIVGAFAERVKFSAVLLFSTIWFTFAYLPVAHMVWFWDGPDAITDEKTLESVTAAAGWLWQKGALDFAGGTVVHINSGVAGLVGAYLIGKRVGFGKEVLAPHSLPLTLVGACLLWVGWFGFNAGSNLEATGVAGMAFINTLIAAACGLLAWSLGEWLSKGEPSMLGAASGAIAGLVGITPACGFVGPMGAIVIGVASGVAALWGVGGLKRMLGADDSLDVFGIHGVAGIVGALLTGVFAAPSLGGAGIFDYVANKAADGYSIGSQVWIQFQAVITTVIWSAVVAAVAFKIVDLVVGLRVSDEQEREGLDIVSHGESAYRY